MKNKEGHDHVLKFEVTQSDPSDYYKQGVWFTLGSVFALSGLYIISRLWILVINLFK